MYSYLDKLQVGKRPSPFSGEGPPHSWGGGAEGAGGARCALQRVLPIHGEVAPKAPEGLMCFATCPPHSWGGGAEGAGGAHVLCNVSSPFMGRWRRRRRRGSLCFATCPPHSWGGGAEGAGGARVPYPEPCNAAPIAPAQIPSAPPTTVIRRTSVT